MATFIILHEKYRGEMAVNLDHIAYFCENYEKDKDKYPGYVLLNRSLMDGLHTTESYDEIGKIIETI